MEVLESRPPAKAPRRWLPPLIGLVVFLVALVGLGAAAADWALQNIEMRSLMTAIESSERSMSEVQQGVSGVLDDLDNGTIPTDDGGTALKAALSTVAADGDEAVAAAGDRVAAVRVAPWHEEIRAAQRAYVTHNQAWQAYLTAAASDPTEFGNPQDNVNASFAAAEAPLLSAVPSHPLFDLLARVQAMFVEPDQPADAGSGGGQQVAA